LVFYPIKLSQLWLLKPVSYKLEAVGEFCEGRMVKSPRAKRKETRNKRKETRNKGE